MALSGLDFKVKISPHLEHVVLTEGQNNYCYDYCYYNYYTVSELYVFKLQSMCHPPQQNTQVCYEQCSGWGGGGYITEMRWVYYDPNIPYISMVG